jgi:hypothetical protein
MEQPPLSIYGCMTQGSDNSPASFEKTLSSLSGKIVQASTRLEAHRRRSRRFRVLWTLYSVFIYLLYAVIVTLVLGWQNWGRIEYSAVAGGPVLYVDVSWSILSDRAY